MKTSKETDRLKRVLTDAMPYRQIDRMLRMQPQLDRTAVPPLEKAYDGAHPLLKIAILDTLYSLTSDSAVRHRLESMLDDPVVRRSEELYAMARIALMRIESGTMDDLDSETELHAVAVPRARPLRARRGVPSMTIVIHGTWASDGEWWRPGGDFFEYLKKDLKIRDLYGKSDQFFWSGKNKGSARKSGARELAEWIKGHPADVLDVLAHSHGANITMLATRRGVKVRRLIMLSPPVRKDYYADWRNVRSAYNIQSDFDPVVAIARGGKWFRLSQVKEKELESNGHSASHTPDVWKREKVDRFVGLAPRRSSRARAAARRTRR